MNGEEGNLKGERWKMEGEGLRKMI